MERLVQEVRVKLAMPLTYDWFSKLSTSSLLENPIRLEKSVDGVKEVQLIRFTSLFKIVNVAIAELSFTKLDFFVGHVMVTICIIDNDWYEVIPLLVKGNSCGFSYRGDHQFFSPIWSDMFPVVTW